MPAWSRRGLHRSSFSLVAALAASLLAIAAAMAKPVDTAVPVIGAITLAGIPGLIAVPAHVLPSTPVVVLYHGFGPPASPEALAKALPPIPNAISLYPWLPLFGPRMGPEGAAELSQRQSEDYVGLLLYPVISGAARELAKLLAEVSRLYGLSNDRPLVMFGFSAGGAAALLALTESDVRPQGVVVLNAPVSIAQAVDGYERQLGRPYSWTTAARDAAAHYDVAAHSSQIAQRDPGTALLFMQSEQDAGFTVGPAAKAAADLEKAARGHSPEPDIAMVSVPNSNHFVLDPSQSNDASAPATAAATRVRTSDWISRHAGRSAY